MQKTIFITGSTDGIGLVTARMLASQGHNVLLHGRNPDKLKAVHKELAGLPGGGRIESYQSDLSNMVDVKALGQVVTEHHDRLDVLINNAGVLRTDDVFTSEGLDIRFAVNIFAPYLLTWKLLPLLGPGSRVVNLSSAAQSPVDLEALAGRISIPDQLNAYAQSKLALTMWSRTVGLSSKKNGPMCIAVNPGSLLATKMVKEGFGTMGNDIGTGAEILVRAALSSEFADASGKYFDNDSGRFASPHSDALDPRKCEDVVSAIESVLVNRGLLPS